MCEILNHIYQPVNTGEYHALIEQTLPNLKDGHIKANLKDLIFEGKEYKWQWKGVNTWVKANNSREKFKTLGTLISRMAKPPPVIMTDLRKNLVDDIITKFIDVAYKKDTFNRPLIHKFDYSRFNLHLAEQGLKFKAKGSSYNMEEFEFNKATFNLKVFLKTESKAKFKKEKNAESGKYGQTVLATSGPLNVFFGSFVREFERVCTDSFHNYIVDYNGHTTAELHAKADLFDAFDTDNQIVNLDVAGMDSCQSECTWYLIKELARVHGVPDFYMDLFCHIQRNWCARTTDGLIKFFGHWKKFSGDTGTLFFNNILTKIFFFYEYDLVEPKFICTQGDDLSGIAAAITLNEDRAEIIKDNFAFNYEFTNNTCMYFCNHIYTKLGVYFDPIQKLAKILNAQYLNFKVEFAAHQISIKDALQMVPNQTMLLDASCNLALYYENLNPIDIENAYKSLYAISCVEPQLLIRRGLVTFRPSLQIALNPERGQLGPHVDV